MSKKSSKLTSDGNNKSEKRIEAGVWIAFIGAMATIIVALFTFPPFMSLFQNAPTPVSSLTSTPTESLVPSATGALTFESAVPPIITMVDPIATSTEEPSLPIGLTVILVADKTNGRVPLTVKFDARDTFLRAADGKIYDCRGGPCFYTWEVYFGGDRVSRLEDNTSGKYEYTFKADGVFIVTVSICRGQDKIDCGGNGAQIIVTK